MFVNVDCFYVIFGQNFSEGRFVKVLVNGVDPLPVPPRGGNHRRIVDERKS